MSPHRKWSVFACALLPTGCAGLALILASPAAAQIVEPRLVAAQGSVYPSAMVREPAIAAGMDKVMSVYMTPGAGAGNPMIGYTIKRPNEPWDREERIVPDPDNLEPDHDPCVAYDSVTGDFVLVCNNPGGGLLIAIYDSQANAFRQLPGASGPGWKEIPHAGDGNTDKPWIVAGEILGEPPNQKQEFYISYIGGFRPPPPPPQPVLPAPAWARSTDGGYTWTTDLVRVGGQPVLGKQPQPTVNGKGPLFMSFLYKLPTNQWVIRVLKGVDSFAMTWDYVYTSPGVPLEIALNEGDSNVGEFLPIPHPALTIGYLAVDPVPGPNDAQILYLSYHDLAQPRPDPLPDPPYDRDVDIFLQKLTETSIAGWTVGPRIQVNDPNPQGRIADQCFPYIVARGGPSGTSDDTRLDVIFYDDRDMLPDQMDSPPPAAPRMNVYYAWSEDAGATFQFADQRLFLNPHPALDPPVADWGLIQQGQDFGILDYICMAAQVEGNGWRLWTSYTGTQFDGDPNTHDAVIWSSQIRWANP